LTIRRFILLIALLSIATASLNAQEQVGKILIYSSDLNDNTSRSIKGIRQTIEMSGQQVEIEIFSPETGNPDEAALRAKLDSYAPDVLVTIGSRSTRIAKSVNPACPIVFASVLSPIASGIVGSDTQLNENITGASLDISVDLQLKHYAKLVPSLKCIGVLFSARTEYMVLDAQVWCRNNNIELKTYRVDGPKDIPTGLKALTKECDGMWALPDELIYTPQSIRHIILETFRNRIPIMGFSPSFVKSGALFALGVDHKFIGIQAGEIALRVLQGIEPSDIEISRPEDPYLYINRNTAEKIRLYIHPDFYAVAREVYD